MSKKTIILISREYGSGGRIIGQKLAAALNIPFYDREIILRSCQESGYTSNLFEKANETDRHPLSYRLTMYSNAVSFQELSINDQIFLIQSKVIREMAKESCVIIGRLADYILRDDPDIIRLFIQAPIQDRIARVKEEYQDNDSNIEQKIHRIDKNRATYYNYYSNQKWGYMKNYDLVINTSKISIDDSVNMLIHLFNQKQTSNKK